MTLLLPTTVTTTTWGQWGFPGGVSRENCRSLSSLKAVQQGFPKLPTFFVCKKLGFLQGTTRRETYFVTTSRDHRKTVNTRQTLNVWEKEWMVMGKLLKQFQEYPKTAMNDRIRQIRGKILGNHHQQLTNLVHLIFQLGLLMILIKNLRFQSLLEA